MDCKDTKEYLGALIDGEVTDSEREEILSHIAECEDCRKEYEELLAIRKEFSKLDVQLRGALADSVMEKICAEAYPVKKKPFFIKHIGTAAALVIIAGLFVYTRLNPIDMADTANEERGIAPDAPTEISGKGDYNYVFDSKKGMIDDGGVAEDTVASGSDSTDSAGRSETITFMGNEQYSQVTSSPKETPDKETVEEPMAEPEKPKAESYLKEEAESDELPSEAPILTDYRYLNSIETDTAIIFVDSEMETVLPLFSDAASIGSNQINVNDYSSNVMDILLSNSIPIISTDIPEGATETAICVE